MDLDMKAGGGGGDQKVQVAVQAVVVLGDDAAATAAPKKAGNALASLKRKGPEPLTDPNKVDTSKLDPKAWFIPVGAQLGVEEACALPQAPGVPRVVKVRSL
jgi:hypothetical protein